ncbi:MAG: hypothetical protein H7X84_04260 [Verrucomicrobia bacterium]|nr:hypothetical protein [Prolixibacteraceae bacterium]
MELEDLKSDWQQADVAFKSEADLLKMTKIKNHPSVKKIKTKLMVEIIFSVLFLAVYYDWFDGDQKPLYANVLLVSSLLLYIANDVIGYLSIVKGINGLNLKASLGKYLARIRRLSVYSLICTLLYNLSFLLFFSSVIHFTKEKSFLLLFLVIILFQTLFWSQRIWNKWINSLEQQVKDFDLDEV